MVFRLSHQSHQRWRQSHGVPWCQFQWTFFSIIHELLDVAWANMGQNSGVASHCSRVKPWYVMPICRPGSHFGCGRPAFGPSMMGRAQPQHPQHIPIVIMCSIISLIFLGEMDWNYSSFWNWLQLIIPVTSLEVCDFDLKPQTWAKQINYILLTANWQGSSYSCWWTTSGHAKHVFSCAHWSSEKFGPYHPPFDGPSKSENWFAWFQWF